MNRDLQIILVSPSAHYPSHNWPITVAQARALRRKGREVRVVIFSTGTEPIPPDLQEIVYPVFSRTPPGWRHIATGKWQDNRWAGLMIFCETLFCLFKALRLARRSAHPALHFLSGSYWLVALAALCFRRIRFVYTLYNEIFLGQARGLKAWVRPHLKKLLQRAVATGRLDFTCENEYVFEKVSALVGDRVQAIPYAIDDDEELPSPEEARRRLGLPPTGKILLFFGTHRREKDYHTALKGCLALPEPPLALFVGKVISDNDPRQVVAGCHYPNARVVDEFVPEEMAKYYFAAADAVALPYEANFARGSGVLIECCRHLRPVIASATPFFLDFLTRHPCGVSYTPGDSAAFAVAAGRLLSDCARYRPALERARHAHSWTAAADQYIKLYDGIRLPETDKLAPGLPS